MEAETSPVRGVGYLAAVTVALDLVASSFVLTVLRDRWQHWLFAATLLASIATMTVVCWGLTVVWHLARSRARRA